MIKKLIQRFALYFVPKTIVYSFHYPRGLYVQSSEIHGRKYITIAVTNKAVKDVPNPAVLHHIPVNDVIGLKKSTTPFENWYYDKVLKKPCPKKKLKKLKK